MREIRSREQRRSTSYKISGNTTVTIFPAWRMYFCSDWGKYLITCLHEWYAGTKDTTLTNLTWLQLLCGNFQGPMAFWLEYSTFLLFLTSRKLKTLLLLALITIKYYCLQVYWPSWDWNTNLYQKVKHIALF